VFTEQQLLQHLRPMPHLDMLEWDTTMLFNPTTTLLSNPLRTWQATMGMSTLIRIAHKSTTRRQQHLQHCHLSISPLSLLMLVRVKNIKQNRAS
jgi:hypothetical protein